MLWGWISCTCVALTTVGLQFTRQTVTDYNSVTRAFYFLKIIQSCNIHFKTPKLVSMVTYPPSVLCWVFLSATSTVSGLACLSSWLCFPFLTPSIHLSFWCPPIFKKQLSVYNTMMLAFFLKMPRWSHFRKSVTQQIGYIKVLVISQSTMPKPALHSGPLHWALHKAYIVYLQGF